MEKGGNSKTYNVVSVVGGLGTLYIILNNKNESLTIGFDSFGMMRYCVCVFFFVSIKMYVSNYLNTCTNDITKHSNKMHVWSTF
jgi:hypothetical protein